MPDPDSNLPAIQATGLDCGYDNKVVLKNLNFTVARGEVFFIIGGSGCGKSTLLRNLIGIQTPMAGTVEFFGEPFTDRDPDELIIGVATDGSSVQVRELLDELDPGRDTVARFTVHTPTLDEAFLTLTGSTTETAPGAPDADDAVAATTTSRGTR